MQLFWKYNFIKLAENAIIVHVYKLLPNQQKHGCNAKNVTFILYDRKGQDKTLHVSKFK